MLPVGGYQVGNYVNVKSKTIIDVVFPYGAGDGNRTRMTSLEGWGSTIELRPQDLPAPVAPSRARTPGRPSQVAYRFRPAARTRAVGYRSNVIP